MHLYELISEIDGVRVIGRTDTEVNKVTSRSCEADSGAIFVCVRGAVTDGEKYVSEVRRRGCRVFVCEREIAINSTETLIICQNSRKMLSLLLSALYGDFTKSMRIIGVTGTKGKTTVAKMICRLLECGGYPTLLISTLGTYPEEYAAYAGSNTTPPPEDLYASLYSAFSCGVRVAVIELSSQALSQYRADGIHIEIGVFCGISRDHIGIFEHKDIEDYVRAKARLFLDFKPDIAVADFDCPIAQSITRGAKKVVSIAKITQAYYRIENIFSTDFGTGFTLSGTPVYLSMPGEYNAKNAALAIAAVTEGFGISPGVLSAVLKGFSVEGRMEQYVLNGRRIIIDFAHNGESVRSALTALGGSKEKRIAVFGSVGGRSHCRRSELALEVRSAARLSVITSDDPGDEPPLDICREIASYYGEGDEYIIVPDRAAAIRAAIRLSEPGDYIFLLGKGHEKTQRVGNKCIPLSEREIITKMGALPFCDPFAK